MSDHPLAAYRKKHGLTLEEFAQRLQSALDGPGVVTRGMVHRWENGTIPRPKFMALISAATDGDITANDFFRKEAA
jgi:transcriptional regulator with XRE-family HTH domain